MFTIRSYIAGRKPFWGLTLEFQEAVEVKLSHVGQIYVANWMEDSTNFDTKNAQSTF